MAPPVEAKKPEEVPASPFVIDEEPAPTEAPAAPAEDPPAAPAPKPIASGHTVPVRIQPSEATPEEKSAFEYKFWHRLHLTLGGGGSYGTRVYGEAEPFNLAAQKLSGPMLLIQPTFTILATNARAEKPNGDFELRAGLELKNHFLSNDKDQSLPESSVDARSVAGLVEGIYHIGRHFGLGGNFNFGRMGLISQNADVGAPFDATLEWGSEGMLTVGGQLFATIWEGNFRFGVNYDNPLGAFELDAGSGNPALRTAVDPIIGFGIGADPIGIVRSIVEGKSGGGDKPKKPK